MGKKFTKPRPRSCAHPIRAKRGTFGSFSAMMSPLKALEYNGACTCT